ncbi:MAG: ATP-dependent RNA helicase HrpA [bacterium]|nr:ATP-dependent RNA helicase HrpA [bacterium]
MHLSYPPALPISERREEIVATIAANQCLILIGDTGSGKTTQLPKMCVEAGRGQLGMIGCTQPRRIAALSVADRVAEETGAPKQIGCKIRFHDRTSPDTLIKFMTDGVLLAETRADRLLSQYDTIIIDEAHERSLNIDFLLGYLKQLLSRRPELKLIISSATIDAERFSAHFDNAPVIAVSGRTYPITTEYWDDAADEENADDISYVDQAVAAIESLCSHPLGGDILVFMPTERDINDTLDGLKHLAESHALLPLFGRLPAAAQRAIFKPAAKRKIIVATNVAETSITVPGIRYVVDTGLARIARYNPRSGTTSLRVSRISQAGCEQRRGRCGRIGPGTCIRLYSEEDYNSREAFTPPEIQRSNLAEVILQMMDLQLGDPAAFPFIDPPPANALRDGYRLLDELGAFSSKAHGPQRRLSTSGRFMARLPLDPRIARIILEAGQQQALRECVVLAAALSIQDPRIRPPEQEGKADMAHRVFLHKRSDFLGLLAIWDQLFISGEKITSSQLSRFCKSNFLSWQRMREWMDVHEQILRLVRSQRRLRFNEAAADYAGVHKSLCSGFLRNICQKKEKNIYLAAGGREVVLFPGSALYNKGPGWAIAAEFVETSQLFARTNAAIEPEWLEALAGDLCKRSWSAPHWEKKSGRIMALERVSLFGLTIISGRRVDYGRINAATRAEAQEIFIRSALIEGELGGRFPFLEHNLTLRQHFEELEDRVRRRGIVVDEEALYAFYSSRLGPAYDRSSLKRLIRDAGSDQFLRLSEEDICRAAPDGAELYRYPPTLRSGGMEIPLEYHFSPGAEDDGVSALISLRQLPDLNPQPFEWLVPGLLPEKVLQLCKRLPKRLRRLLVPLPEAVDRLLDGLDQYQGSLYQELERVILRQYQVKVERADWQADTLPPHLKMRFVLQDDSGQVLAQSRSFSDLLQGHDAVPLAEHTTLSLPETRRVESRNLDGIDAVISLQAAPGKPELLAYASLQADQGGRTVELHYVTSKEESRAQIRAGLHLLITQDLAKDAAGLRKLCKDVVSSQSASWLSLGAGVSAAELQRLLFAFVIDAVFALDMEVIPSQDQYDAAMAAVRREGLLRPARAVLERVVQLVRQRRELAGAIQQWAGRARQARNYDAGRHQDYQAALERIVPSNFLEELSADSLRERVRYLQGLAVRIERAEHDPKKDALKAERLQGPENRLSEAARFLRQAGHSSQCRACLSEYNTMLEEFRISVFAPELGTKQPVSEKRLRQKWAEVENICRRVE